MNRIKPVEVNRATGRAAELLEAVRGKLGVVPNMMRAMANSPAVLEAYLNFSGALSKGALDLKTREAIALAVGQANRCQYCVSAHTLLGQKAGLSHGDVSAARTGEAGDPRTAAALQLAVSVNNDSGHVPDAALARARTAGLSDGEIAEVVATVAFNIFTNYFNHVAETQLD